MHGFVLATKKKCTLTNSLKVLVDQKKNLIRIYKYYNYTSKCSSNSMWLLCMLSTTSFVGS